MKYGLMNYLYGKYSYFTPINFGDEIQSLAASYFLPQIDYFVDRESICNNISNEPFKMIMNGWYTHDETQWSPNKNIIPLLTSIHISPRKNQFIKKIFTSKNISYLLNYTSKYGSIGTRDIATLELFQKYNIPAFFSGCLTLTLPKNPNVKKQDFILCVDIPTNIVYKIKKYTKRKVFCISPAFNYPIFDPIEKFIYAKSFLDAYQSAYAIITTRLHTAMPSLALETPVLLLDDSNGIDIRFTGLDKLVRKTTSKFYQENMDFFDINNITNNDNKYLIYRNKLIQQCEQFTEYKQQQQSPLFNINSLEEQNIKNLEVLNQISNRFSEKTILYKYHSKELILAALKRRQLKKSL